MSSSIENKTMAVGTATTEQASSYIRKLCKHWSHKLEVRYDETSGEVKFPGGYCELDANQAGTLIVKVSAPDAETVQSLQGVVESHLQQFATQETLNIVWANPVAVS